MIIDGATLMPGGRGMAGGVRGGYRATARRKRRRDAQVSVAFDASCGFFGPCNEAWRPKPRGPRLVRYRAVPCIASAELTPTSACGTVLAWPYGGFK